MTLLYTHCSSLIPKLPGKRTGKTAAFITWSDSATDVHGARNQKRWEKVALSITDNIPISGKSIFLLVLLSIRCLSKVAFALDLILGRVS